MNVRNVERYLLGERHKRIFNWENHINARNVGSYFLGERHKKNIQLSETKPMQEMWKESVMEKNKIMHELWTMIFLS